MTTIFKNIIFYPYDLLSAPVLVPSTHACLAFWGDCDFHPVPRDREVFRRLCPVVSCSGLPDSEEACPGGARKLYTF